MIPCRSARGSATESQGGHPLVSVNGLHLEYPCSLPPLKPPPDTHPSLRVTSRHTATSIDQSTPRLLLDGPQKTAAVNNSTVPKRNQASSGRSRQRSASSSSSVHSELDRFQASNMRKEPRSLSLSLSSPLSFTSAFMRLERVYVYHSYAFLILQYRQPL